MLEILCLCLVFWLICYLATGTDEKNLKGLSAYPDKIQAQIKADPILGSKVKTVSPEISFCSSLLLYTPLLLVLCWFVRENGFFSNFRNVLVMGEILNAFDFLVIDLLWWRHTKRVRFSGTENQSELYHDPKKHFISFAKGVAMFFIAAAIDGLILSLF